MSSFSFSGAWGDTIQDTLKEWLIEKWTSTTGEAPDQDFLEYILVMIKNQKKMDEICHELKDLGVEEPNASEFVSDLGKMLMSLSDTTSVQSETSVKLSVSSKNGGGENAKSTLTTGSLSGSSRLLNSALQSSRGTAKQTENAIQRKQHQGDSVGNKRGLNESDNRTSYRNVVVGTNNTNQTQFSNKHYKPNGNGQQFQQQNQQMPFHHQPPPPHMQHQQQPPYPPHPAAAPAPVAGPGLDTVKYFEQMNAVAQMSGFRNAQEMLASQREMMAMMAHGPAALGAAPQHPPLPPVPAPHHGAQPPYPTHPPTAEGYHPAEGGYRGGRGAGRGYQGRGFIPGFVPGGRRGRGGYVPGAGRGFHPAAAAAVASEGEAVAVPVTDSTVVAEGAVAAPLSTGLQTAPVVSGYRGRGGPWRGAPGRGRGAGGRGAPFVGADGAAAAGNKVWVREANIDSSLVSSR